MNFKILNDNINFSNEFVKLNEIRGIFLEEALNSVSTFRNKFKEKFNDNEQVKKDAEAFGYEYLKQYISKAIGIIKDFNVKNINEDEYKIIYKVKDSSGNETKNERILIKNKPKQNESVIYLTFDDGPSLDITPHILDILKEENVKATFFILDYNNKKEELVKREAKEGHSIGLHGVSHNYKDIYGSLENGLNNFINLNNKVKESTGIDTKLIRFPGGSSNTVSKFNPGIMTNLAVNLLEKGYKYYDWNVASGDSGDVKTKEAVYNNVTKGIRKNRNNIVLMHDFSGNTKTLNALRDIIRYGKNNGYNFERITENTPMITQKIVN